ncbi:unnamed protein product [Sphenostylis stenocarpa]|uniref:Speckle-type POZ protein n=1 Tax=Sphenostylis stenocarpa TaxID=92480 RepID=A0AA86RRW2_9FABA|nr:unnamed protein product [Sphenostylis stenocarpa]
MTMYNPTAESSTVLTPLTGSLSVMDRVNGSHNFVLKGYSLTKGMGTGKFIASKTFTVGGHQWAIYFYPEGKVPSENGVYVSVFVALVSEGTDVRALFELKLLDQSDKGTDLVYTHFGRSLENGPYTIKTRGCIWGYKRFIKRKDLEASTSLKDDCLKIDCTVGVLVVSSSSDSSMLNAIHVPESDMGADLGMMLDYEELCDVTFSLGGERFRAHKLILATRSSVFETWLSNGVGNDDKEIVLTDIEHKIFKALLHFIYTDTLMEDEDLFMWESSSLLSVSESFPAKLLAAAEKYDLPRLKMMCESVLCKDISIDSVAYILVVADRYRATQLMETVTKSDSFQYLRKKWLLLHEELLNSVVDLDNFIVHVQSSEDGYTNDRKQPTLERGESSRVHLSDDELIKTQIYS